MDKSEIFKRIIWDYNVVPSDVEAIFNGEKETFSLNREKLISRMLTSVKWYDLVDVFGNKQLAGFLTDSVLNHIKYKGLKENLLYARSVLNGN